MSNPKSLHEFDIWYLQELFSIIQNDTIREKYKDLFLKFGYINSKNFNSIKYLDDIVISIKLFQKEYKEIKYYDKIIQIYNRENKDIVTERGFVIASSICQSIYSKMYIKHNKSDAYCLLYNPNLTNEIENDF